MRRHRRRTTCEWPALDIDVRAVPVTAPATIVFLSLRCACGCRAPPLRLLPNTNDAHTPISPTKKKGGVLPPGALCPALWPVCAGVRDGLGVSAWDGMATDKARDVLKETITMAETVA